MAPFQRVLDRELGRVGPERDSPDPDARIPVRVALALLESGVELTGDPTLGLRAALEADRGDFGLFEYVAFSARTLGKSIPVLQRYACLLNDALEVALERSGDRAILRFTSRVQLTRAAADFQLAAFYRGFVRGVFSKAGCRSEVWRTCDPPLDDSAYVHAFEGADIRFAAPCDAIVVEQHLLDRDFGDTDPKLHDLLRRFADERLERAPCAESLSGRVRATIIDHLGEGMASVAQVARKLHMSRRTLARRLEWEGTCFRSILEDLRRELAERHLAIGELSVGEIAIVLGFSDSAAFNRAFRRWHDCSPSEYRRAQRPRQEREVPD